MNIARLGAATAAAGVVVLCAAGPAFATGQSPAPNGYMKKGQPSSPSATPTAKPTAPEPKFGVSPQQFTPGETVTFTVMYCPVRPTIRDLNHLFVKTVPFKRLAKGSFVAKEVTRKNLKPGEDFTVVVKCGDVKEKFTTSIAGKTSPSPKPTSKPSMTPTTSASPIANPTGTPVGAPQTGDGTSSGGGNTGLMAAGIGVVLAGLAGGGYLFARRRPSTDS